MTANQMGRWLDRLASRVEHAAGLDRAAEPLSTLAERLTAAPPLRHVLSGTPVGHPVHPLLVTIPIGSWTAAMMLDCLRRQDSAQTLVGFGALAAAPAAWAGLNDWRDTSGAERRVGLVHAALNSGVLLLYGASWLARRRGRHGLGVALPVPPMTLLMVSGWLGGHLSYALGVGVDTTAFQTMGEDWADAIAADEVSNGNLSMAEVDGVPVVLTRTSDDTVVAYGARCTHRGGPLHEGELVDGCLVCPWHGSQFFVADGPVAQGPATRPQPRYETRIVGDRVQVRRPTEPRSLRTDPAGH